MDNQPVQHAPSDTDTHSALQAARCRIVGQPSDISPHSPMFAPIEVSNPDAHLAEHEARGILRFMGKDRHIQRYMAEGRRILLGDGRTGRIVRIDTSYPLGETRVSVWVGNLQPSDIAEVTAEDVVGLAPLSA